MFVVLSNGPAIRGQTQYGVQLLQEKINKGFLPWYECPITRGYVRGPKFKPTDECKGKDGRGKLSSPCGCLLDIQKNRTAAHEERSKEFSDRMQGPDALQAQYIKMKIQQEMGQESVKKTPSTGKKK